MLYEQATRDVQSASRGVEHKQVEQCLPANEQNVWGRLWKAKPPGCVVSMDAVSIQSHRPGRRSQF